MQRLPGTELALLNRVQVVVALGKIAHDNYLAVLKDEGRIDSRAPYVFGHNDPFDEADTDRLVSSEPAEYVYRQTYRTHVDGCFRESKELLRLIFITEEAFVACCRCRSAIECLRSAFLAYEGEAQNQPRRRLILPTGSILHSMAASYGKVLRHESVFD